MKYWCLLRGINVGGKNKVAMSDLKDCFTQAGFKAVSSYINSGNVLFESSEEGEAKLVKKCEQIIEKQFGFHVICTVVSVKNLSKALANTPSWWVKHDRKQVRSDALFIIPPADPKEILAEIKTKADSPDKFAISNPIIFWSLPMADYNKSVVPKIIGSKIYKSITIRNSNTTKKLVELSQP